MPCASAVLGPWHAAGVTDVPAADSPLARTDGVPLTATTAAYAEGLAAGQHVGLQLAVRVDGEPVVDLAHGLAREGVPMRTDSVVIWFSTSKILAAVAIGQLWERGLVALDVPVRDYLPEFGAHGKEAITPRHLLTHTGGFRHADGQLGGFDAEVPVAELYARVCDGGLEEGWQVGVDAGYHGGAGHVVLGELVHRLTGTPYDEYLRREVLDVVGADDWWMGLPREQQERYGDRVAQMWWCQDGLSGPVPGLDTEAARARPHPGMGGRGPARDLVAVVDQLRRDQAGTSQPVLVRAQTWEAMTARHRTGVLDRTFQAHLDWGLGLIPPTVRTGDGPEATRPQSYGYGAHTHRRAWGHSGSQSSTAFADPERGLSVAVMWNGMPGHLAHTRRQAALLTALYEDLGLA